MDRQRRKKGDGGLYKQAIHSGSYEYEYWIAEWQDASGHKRRASGYTPEQALARKNARMKAEEPTPPRRKQHDTVGTPRNPSVAQAMEQWLLNAETIGETSRGKYRRNLERYVLPYIGSKAVRRLTPAEMSALKAEWKRRHVGQSAARHTWKTLHTMLGSLVKEGLLKTNPMDPISAPRCTNRRAEYIEMYIDDHTRTALGIMAWTGKDGTPMHRYYGLVMAMALGLRRAEALGITQAALDPGEQVLEVRTRLKQRAGGGYFLQPATKNGHYRAIRLPHLFYAALSGAVRKDAATLPIEDEDGTKIGKGKILLTREDGRNYSYNDWGAIWREIQVKYKQHVWGASEQLEESEYILPHEMRHITASLLGEQGESMKTVQSILGHMTPEMTEHYTHLLESGQSETAKRWGESLENLTDFIGHTMEEAAKVNTSESDSDGEKR